MKKIWFILLCIISAAVVFYLLWSSSGYLLSAWDDSKLILPEKAVLLPAGDPRIGKILAVKAEFKLPRYRKIIHISTAPGEGTVLSQPVAAHKIKSAWKYNTYVLEGFICCLRPGDSKPGSITVEISPGKKMKKPQRFVLTIPGLKIREIPNLQISAPELAGESPLLSPPSPWLHLLWLLLLIPAAAVWLFLRKKKSSRPPLSLRQRTLNALDSLRSEVFSRHLTAREGIAGVSDLLRNYLEERYALPASGKTTPEFLEDMEYNSAIPARAGTFLRNFLNTADMIKFAQAPCDASAVSTAVDSAVELVENTSLPDKEEK